MSAACTMGQLAQATSAKLAHANLKGRAGRPHRSHSLVGFGVSTLATQHLEVNAQSPAVADASNLPRHIAFSRSCNAMNRGSPHPLAPPAVRNAPHPCTRIRLQTDGCPVPSVPPI